MHNSDFNDLLGDSLDSMDDILGEKPLMPTREEVENAHSILRQNLEAEQRKTEIALAKSKSLPSNYKKFDPLNHKNAGFDNPNFGSPQELVELIDEFFKQVESEDSAFRITPSPSALAMHLNVSRKKLFLLEEQPLYGPIILAAKTRIEAYLESALMDGRRTNSGGIALVLKNGFDWKEKQEVSGELTFTVTRQMFSEPPQMPMDVIEGEIQDA